MENGQASLTDAVLEAVLRTDYRTSGKSLLDVGRVRMERRRTLGEKFVDCVDVVDVVV
jgi:hypothetical protein